MKTTSIRNFAYAALLAFTTLTFMPSAAFGQEHAHGAFTLTHDVRWQNANIPAGEYKFSFAPEGAGGMLVLSKLNGARTGFMLMVTDAEESKITSLNRLVIENISGGTYVSAMQLPEFGMTLHFVTPPRTAEKEIAKAATIASASIQ